jgi:arylsulfatase A-like enzyme
MNARRLGLLGLGVAGLALAALWARPSPRARPNVLVVVWDTVRADHLSLYGYGRPTTPRLDAFARDAVVFERASSPGIWTLPSHASMFTGLPPETHGADERQLWLDAEHTTLAEHFAAHGYVTFAMAANTLLCDETNLVQGFEVQLNTFRGKAAKAAKAATRRKVLPQDRSNELAPLWTEPAHGAKHAQWARAAYKEAAPLVTDTLLRWLDARQDPEQPFFAFLNLMEAHTPRIPSMEARQQVLADDPALVEQGLQVDAGHIHLHFYNFGKHAYTEREREAIGGVYDATLWDLDQATGALLDALRQRGLLEETVVVVTSDHGENLGEHGLFNHRFSLWEALVHVPLVIRAPGVPPQRVERPVSTVDLFATLSRLARLPVPETISSGDLLGPTPSPAVTTLTRPLEREVLVVQEVHPDVPIEPWMRSGHALVDGPHKLISMSDGTELVFDLRADPGERRPLQDAAARDRLVDALRRWQSSVRPYDGAAQAEASGTTPPRPSSRELCEQMAALGYFTGDCE